MPYTCTLYNVACISKCNKVLSVLSFRKHGATGGDQSVYKCRKFLGRLVENLLSDVDKGNK